jgi:uncharacterized protein with beta-barrel porin domain
MLNLRRALMLCVAVGSLSAMASVAQATPAPPTGNRCFDDRDIPTFNTRTTIDTLPDGGDDYPPYPGEGSDLGACGSLELNASAIGIVGMPGSPFFTTVFQRMMTPVGQGGGGASAPLGYAQQPKPADDSPFASLDQMIEGRNADLATKAPVGPAPMIDPNLIWVRGAGRWANYDGVNGGPGASLQTGAVFAGVDLPVSPDFRIGFAGGWSDSRFDMDDNSGTLDADAWHASLYATGASGNWRTKGIVTYERYDLSSRRPVEFDTQTARADYNADHVEALGELSYVQQVGANTAVEPYVSAGVSWVQVDGFTEKVNGNDYLSADQQEETWPYTLIGMRLMGAMNVGSVLVNPMVDLGWRHVFGDTDPDLVYEGLDGESFAVAGMPIAEDSLVVQAGFDAAFTSGWRTSLKYKGDIAQTAQQHTVTGGVALPF